jgi:hypothetical protein
MVDHWPEDKGIPGFPLRSETKHEAKLLSKLWDLVM